MSKRPEASLAYSSPAHGGWGIVRVGMLVPECHQLFVCPFACGRHGAIGAINHGYKDRLSYLYIDETDIVSGGYEELIVEAADELLRVIAPRPKALLIVVSCLDDLLGTDHEAFLAELRRMHPDVRFGTGHMNPISAEGKLPPAINIQRSIYSYLEPVAQRDKMVNIIGCNVKKDPEGELFTLLRDLGYGARHISDFARFDDYLQLAASSLNIVVGPTALAAAKEMQARLGIDYITLPISYAPEEIEGHYAELIAKLAPQSGYVMNCTDLYAQLEDAVAKARRVIGERPIAIDDSAVLRPYSLAKALWERDFRVELLCTEACPAMEEDSCRWLKEHTSIQFVNHTKHNAPVERQSRPELLAVGFECGYYFGSHHVVELLDDEELFGFHGFCALLEKMCAAARAQSDLDDILKGYGLVV